MKDKKAKIFSAIALLALALLVVGATYAYFQNQYGSASNAVIKVTTYTTDVLTFETGDAINISADQETFAQGKGNRTGSTFARATLQANNKTNTATANYYMYLNIENNTFTYTNTGTPELILQVVDKNSGNQVTSITGLDYVTVTDGKNTSISGFDITTKKGLIALFSNKVISASPKKAEEYTVTITLVNHSFDQNNNTGKNLNGKLIIQKDEYRVSLADYVISQYTGKQGENNIYYHDSNLENGAGDNSYRFVGENPNNYVCFGSDDTTCPNENLYRIIGVIDGKVKLIHAYGATTFMLGTDGVYKEIYSYDKSNYKGKGDLKKIGGYYWNIGKNNKWSTSVANTTNLNKNFLAYLDGKNAKWKNMIANTTWYVGGMTYNNGEGTNAKTAYNYEVVPNKDATSFTTKVGLMYVSDYYYGTLQEYWRLPGNDNDGNDYRTIIKKNWMSLGLSEWTITRGSDDSRGAFVIIDVGNVFSYGVEDFGLIMRPTFYIYPLINITGGEGTATNPIRLTD